MPFPGEDRTLCDPAQAVEHLRKNLWHKKKTIIVKSPNGGELLIPGGTFEITWKASSSIENVKIILSSDSGESYVDLIELFAPNTGSYNWDFIPATWVDATNRIRILDAVDSDVYDHSNRDFSILNRPESPITLLMPNGGETWVAGTSREITWTALPTIEHVKIELLLLDGNQEPEPVVIAQSTRNDGVFVWNSIPVEYVRKFCRVIVSDAGDPALYDESDASFAILRPAIHVLSPDGGEDWEIGRSGEIKWEASETIERVTILLSQNGGQTYLPIVASTPNDGRYVWPAVAASEGSTCRIKVVDPLTAVNDTSDSNFAVLAGSGPAPDVPSIQVVSPNGGEILPAGGDYEINWAATLVDEVNIEVSIDGGQSYALLDTQEENDGVYIWESISDAYIGSFTRIRISDFYNPTKYVDASDASFTITAPTEIPAGSPTI